MAKNKNLSAAKAAKNDEFYTRLTDIEHEISMHEDYVRQFQGKTVLCNCDDPEKSAFFDFFRLHFKQLGLKKAIFTHYEKDDSPSYKLEWDGSYLGYDTLNLIKTPLEGNGDFRSPECVALLDECDIVVTNPPFSLFREFVHLIIDHGKDFAIIGNKNAITYKEIFPLIKENKVALGYESPNEFKTPEGTITKQVNGLCRWFTTLDLDKYHEELFLGCKYAYHPERYPKYDNYNAINVDKVKEIPCDYDGVMGVPVTFLDRYCPEQFEIVGCPDANVLPDGWSGMSSSFVSLYYEQGNTGAYRAGNRMACYVQRGVAIIPYKRILIRRKPTNND